MKFAQSESEITKADDENFTNKVDTFLRQTGTRKSLMFTLITSFGVKRNVYSGRVQRQVTLRELIQ